jgi:serine/threonine-protein kinase
VKVPDVTGKNLDQATKILTQLGLKVDATRFFGDQVRQQAPKPGKVVDQGTTIRVLVSF